MNIQAPPSEGLPPEKQPVPEPQSQNTAQAASASINLPDSIVSRHSGGTEHGNPAAGHGGTETNEPTSLNSLHQADRSDLSQGQVARPALLPNQPVRRCSNSNTTNEEDPCLKQEPLDIWRGAKGIKIEGSTKPNLGATIKVEDRDLHLDLQPIPKSGGLLQQQSEHSLSSQTSRENDAPSDPQQDAIYITCDDGSSEDDDMDKDPDYANSTQTPQVKKTGSKKKRAPPAKDAREFLDRLYAKQRAAEEKKRRREEEQPSSRKAQKTDPQSHNQQHSLCDTLVNSSSTGLQTMPTIQATTQAEQFRQIEKNIPAGCDLRRVKTQKKDLKEAAKLFGYRKVFVRDGGYRHSGMKSWLRDYQQVASAWMVKREYSQTGPHGGIIADAMGLGKTVISLNTIVGHPPTTQDTEVYSQATLVVVPSQDVARQWYGEVYKHCLNPGMVIVHSRSHWFPTQQYKMCFMVIITYADLVKQMIPKKELKALQKAFGTESLDYEREKKARIGQLFHVDWYRVILDEAHSIKNHYSITAMACWELNSKYRWALTGTPLSNDAVEEFYPYLKFLQCNIGTLSQFKKTYCSKDELDSRLTSSFMLRRTQNDAFLGFKMVDIPESHSSDLWIPLSKEEQAVFQMVDDYYHQLVTQRLAAKRRKMNQDEEEAALDVVASNELTGNSDEIEHLISQIWALRLRQGASHPFNLEKYLRDSVGKEYIRKLQSTLGDLPPVPIIEQLKSGENFEIGLSRYNQGLEALKSKNLPVFGRNFKIDELLTLIQNEYLVKKNPCAICKKPFSPVKPVRSANCEHVYCKLCLITHMVESGRDHTSLPSRIAKETARQALTCFHTDCSAPLDIGPELPTLLCIEEEARLENYKETECDSNKVHLKRKKGEQLAFLASTREDSGVTLPPGSKLTAAMAVILTWMEEAPEDKIIVFYEFLMTAKVLGHMLELSGIGFLFYNGVMSPGRKAKALESFQYEPKHKILLASMRCGAQSLNLDVANRVIIVDPWWNKTQEQQAFGRVVRRGQKKHTYLVRILAEGRIDKRLTELQKHKSESIDRALQDDGHIPEVMTDEDLMKVLSEKGSPSQGTKQTDS